MTKENLTKKEKIEKHIEWLVDNEIYCCASWIMDDLLKYAEEHPKDAAIDMNVAVINTVISMSTRKNIPTSM